VLHHLNNSRSQRIIWLLEELGIEYTIKKYERVQGLAPKELKKVHPLGKSPIITDGGKTIIESAVIIDYLIAKYGKGRFDPKNEAGKDLNSFWTHFSEGSLMCPLVITQVFNTVETQSPWIIRPIAKAISGQVQNGFTKPTINAQWEYVESELQKTGGEFMIGDNLTASDFMMLFPVETATQRSDIIGSKTKAWLQRVHSRPAYRKALEKGGEYAYAK